jgi:hypothetical protein
MLALLKCAERSGGFHEARANAVLLQILLPKTSRTLMSVSLKTVVAANIVALRKPIA